MFVVVSVLEQFSSQSPALAKSQETTGTEVGSEGLPIGLKLSER